LLLEVSPVGEVTVHVLLEDISSRRYLFQWNLPLARAFKEISSSGTYHLLLEVSPVGEVTVLVLLK
jgi:hypothetical protein